MSYVPHETVGAAAYWGPRAFGAVTFALVATGCISVERFHDRLTVDPPDRRAHSGFLDLSSDIPGWLWPPPIGTPAQSRQPSPSQLKGVGRSRVGSLVLDSGTFNPPYDV